MNDPTFGPRLMPTDWRDRFRKIEPTATMVDAGNGFWMVGSTHPGNQELASKGTNLLEAALSVAEEARDIATIRKGRAAREIGFAFIALYTDAELYNGWAFIDFALRNYNWQDFRRYMGVIDSALDYKHLQSEQRRRDWERDRQYRRRHIIRWGYHRPIHVPMNSN